MALEADPQPGVCSDCGTAVPLGASNVSQVAQCPFCKRALDLATGLGPSGAPSRTDASLNPQSALDAVRTQPGSAVVGASGVLLLRGPDHLELRVRGGLELTPASVGGLIASAFFPFLFFTVVADRFPQLENFPIWLLVACWVPGLLAVFSSALGLRTLRLGASQFEVSYSPVPWFRRRIDPRTLVDADVSEQFFEGEGGVDSWGWNVMVRQRDDAGLVPLTLRVKKFEDAAAVQAVVNRYLRELQSIDAQLAEKESTARRASGETRALPPLRCPQCSAEIRWDDVSEATRTAGCAACRRVFDLTGGQRSGGGSLRARPEPKPEAALAIAKKARVARPGSVQVTEGKAQLVIEAPDRRRRWRVARAAVGLASTALAALVVPTAALPVLGLVAAGAIWALLACATSRLRVEVRDAQLKLGPYPLWLPGLRSFPPKALRQLFVQNRAGRGIGTAPARPHYALVGILERDGTRVDLVPDIADVELALWLEQVLEGALRIVDEPVKGELPRPPASKR